MTLNMCHMLPAALDFSKSTSQFLTYRLTMFTPLSYITL